MVRTWVESRLADLIDRSFDVIGSGEPPEDARVLDGRKPRNAVNTGVVEPLYLYRPRGVGQ